MEDTALVFEFGDWFWSQLLVYEMPRMEAIY